MNKLFVPIPIEAFVTDGKSEDNKRVAQVAPYFDQLKEEMLGANLESLPFTTTDSLLRGVHLHFILPDALLHADHDSTNEVLTYRCIPNRWVVTRFVKTTSITIKSWIIESDYLGDDNPKSILFPMEEADGNMSAKHLGRVYAFKERVDYNGQYLSKLHAFGWGDPAFAASYQHCSSVLGFHDDLSDVSMSIGATICYAVMGYYSKEENDPLHGITSPAAYQSLLKDFEWRVDNPEIVPDGLICHGLVFNIGWNAANANADAQPTKGVDIAVGNSSQEALAALLAKKLTGNNTVENPERLLNALQRQILSEANEIDGVFKIQDYLHGKTFAIDDADLKWVVRRTDKKNDPDMQEPTGFANDLDQLNKNQFALDDTNRKIISLQQNMYVLWFDYTNTYEDYREPTGGGGGGVHHEEEGGGDFGGEEEGGGDFSFVVGNKSPKLLVPHKDYDFTRDPGKPGQSSWDFDKCTDYQKLIKDYATQMDQLKSNADSYHKNIAGYSSTIRKKINETKGYYQLQPVPRESFYRPADPVCLLSGEGVGRNYLYGRDGRLSDHQLLPCRNNLISSLTKNNGGTIGKDQILKYFPVYEGDITGKPTFYSDLLCEFLCLNPDTLNVIRGKYNDNSLKVTQYIPYDSSICNWKQPWNTLYLEWEVSYFAVNDIKDPAEAMKDWALRDIDYETSHKGADDKKYQHTGRSLLLPHSVELFSDTIENFADQLADDSETQKYLKEAAAQIMDVPILSQTFAGATDALLGKQKSLTLPPINTILYKEWDLAGIINKYVDTAQRYTPLTSQPFIPIRGGYLSIDRINIISSFGHIHHLEQGSDTLTLSEQCLPEVEEYKVKNPVLRSRINQPLRLEFNWISRDLGIHANEDPATSCVCGYFLPSQLESSLMIYDVDGVHKGSVKYVLRDGYPMAAWNSSPLESLKDFDEISFTNIEIKKFIKALLTNTETVAGVFSNLLDLMDIRQRSCYNTGNHDTSIIWGKPLVLVKAAMQFELAGYPALSYNKNELLNQTTKQFETINLDVKIGDAHRNTDGVFAYFQGDGSQINYGQIFLANGLDSPTAPSGYMQFGKDISIPLKSDHPTYLSMLMNPDAVLTLRTGLLPCQQHRIPPQFIRHSIQDLEMFFEVNSIVSQEHEISVPIREEAGFSWSFLHRGTDYHSCKEFKEIIPPANVFAENRSILIDGYFKTKKENN